MGGEVSTLSWRPDSLQVKSKGSAVQRSLEYPGIPKDSHTEPTIGSNPAGIHEDTGHVAQDAGTRTQEIRKDSKGFVRISMDA